MTDQPELPLPDPTDPQVIECSNNDYLAKLAELRRDGWHVKGVRVLEGGYRLTVRYAVDDQSRKA